jgi:fluoroquinolone resistance protein
MAPTGKTTLLGDSACKIAGAEFFKCEKTFFSANFKNSLLQYCNFSDLNMKNSSFKGSKLKDSHFTNTILKGADFSDVDLSGTVFHNCDLCNADFSSAVQYDIDPRTNKIKKAKFSLPEAAGLLRAFDITIV